MDPLLAFDVEAAKKRCVEFIRHCLADAGFEKVVLGLSGGVDSAVVAALCAEAAGCDNTLALLMPYKTSSPSAIEDAEELARLLGIRTETLDITPVVDAFVALRSDADKVRRGNFAARTRMALLFDTAKRSNALVAGTGNRTEYLLGYFTLFGDGAFSFAPIIWLYKTQVWELARYLGIPKKIVEKKPSADLWPGQTDEEELGITYKEADAILVRLVDRGMSVEDVVGAGFARDKVEHIVNLMRRTEFKRRGPRLLGMKNG